MSDPYKAVMESPTGPHVAADDGRTFYVPQGLYPQDIVHSFCSAEIERLRAEVYHTAPGELTYGGEGWTWKQQARANEDRLHELEAEVARLGGVVAAAVQAEQAARDRVRVLEEAAARLIRPTLHDELMARGMHYTASRLKDLAAALNPPAKAQENP